MQTVAWQVWKIYAEGGQDERSKSRSRLLGLSYEGSSTYTLHAEWYGRDKTWAPPSPLFADQSYAIISAGAVELADRFNLTETVVKSLEHRSYFSLARCEWLASDHQVVGLTMIDLYPAQLFQWQAVADWKYSL